MAVGAIVVSTFVGVGLASHSALPGDPLYPIKRTLESVQVATAGSPADKGGQLLSQASTRLSEVQNLVDEHSSDPAVSVLMGGTLSDFSTQAHQGGADLMTAYRNNDDTSAIVDLRTFTSSSATRLEAMSTQVPPAVLADVAGAASELTTLDAGAVRTCPSCSALAPLALPANLETLVSDVQAGKQPTLPTTAGPADPGAPTSLLPPTTIAPVAPGTTPAPIVVLPTIDPGTGGLPTDPTDVPTTAPVQPTTGNPTTDPVTDPTTDPASTNPTTAPTTAPPTTSPPTTDPTTALPTTAPPTTNPPATDPNTTNGTSTDTPTTSAFTAPTTDDPTSPGTIGSSASLG